MILTELTASNLEFVKGSSCTFLERECDHGLGLRGLLSMKGSACTFLGSECGNGSQQSRSALWVYPLRSRIDSALRA